MARELMPAGPGQLCGGTPYHWILESTPRPNLHANGDLGRGRTGLRESPASSGIFVDTVSLLVGGRADTLRVLFVTPTPPFPPKEGDELVVYEQIRRLGRVAEIHLVTLVEDGISEEAAAGLGSLCTGVHLVRGGPDMKRIGRSLYNGLPMLVNMFLDADIARQMDRIARAVRPDLVHVQSIRLAEYFRWRPVARVLDLIDADSLNAARRAQFERPIRRLAYRAEARLLRHYEERVLRDFHRVLLVSRHEAAHFATARGHIVVNPNGISFDRARLEIATAPPPRRALLFHGTMSYFPNVDAVLHFARAIFPRLRARFPDLELRIVGRWPTPSVAALHDGRTIVVTGEVEDVVPELKAALVGVYPLRAGTGLQNKVLEALACKLPAVVSPRALAGLEHLEEESHLLVARSDDEWVKKVAGLVEDEDARQRLAVAGCEAVFLHYSWDENARRLLGVWQQVTADAGITATALPTPVPPPSRRLLERSADGGRVERAVSRAPSRQGRLKRRRV